MTGKAAPLIIILGPTGVGKTGLAIALAKVLAGEIIGADSRQIYRYMDIGTAKPTAEQQALIPHHLIDMAPPDYNLSLAEYQDAAYRAIDAVRQRGKLPFLVGGSGQYLTAIEEGWSIPRVPPNSQLRAELETFVAENSPVGAARAAAPGRSDRRGQNPPQQHPPRDSRAGSAYADGASH